MPLALTTMPSATGNPVRLLAARSAISSLTAAMLLSSAKASFTSSTSEVSVLMMRATISRDFSSSRTAVASTASADMSLPTRMEFSGSVSFSFGQLLLQQDLLQLRALHHAEPLLVHEGADQLLVGELDPVGGFAAVQGQDRDAHARGILHDRRDLAGDGDGSSWSCCPTCRTRPR